MPVNRSLPAASVHLACPRMDKMHCFFGTTVIIPTVMRWCCSSRQTSGQL